MARSRSSRRAATSTSSTRATRSSKRRSTRSSRSRSPTRDHDRQADRQADVRDQDPARDWLTYSDKTPMELNFTAPKDLEVRRDQGRSDKMKIEGQSLTAAVTCTAPKGGYQVRGDIRFGYDNPVGRPASATTARAGSSRSSRSQRWLIRARDRRRDRWSPAGAADRAPLPLQDLERARQADREALDDRVRFRDRPERRGRTRPNRPRTGRRRCGCDRARGGRGRRASGRRGCARSSRACRPKSPSMSPRVLVEVDAELLHALDRRVDVRRARSCTCRRS